MSKLQIRKQITSINGLGFDELPLQHGPTRLVSTHKHEIYDSHQALHLIFSHILVFFYLFNAWPSLCLSGFHAPMTRISPSLAARNRPFLLPKTLSISRTNFFPSSLWWITHWPFPCILFLLSICLSFRHFLCFGMLKLLSWPWRHWEDFFISLMISNFSVRRRRIRDLK